MTFVHISVVTIFIACCIIWSYINASEAKEIWEKGKNKIFFLAKLLSVVGFLGIILGFAIFSSLSLPAAEIILRISNVIWLIGVLFSCFDSFFVIENGLKRMFPETPKSLCFFVSVTLTLSYFITVFCLTSGLISSILYL